MLTEGRGRGYGWGMTYHRFRVLLAAVLLPCAATLAVAGGGGEAAGIVTELQFPTFWVGQDSKAAPIAELIDQFNADHEGRVNVVLESNPDTDGYRTKIQTGMAVGQVPDVFVFAPGPTQFQYYASDLLLDFTDDLAGPWGDTYVAGAVAGATRDGRTKSVPFEIGVVPIWYNTELLESAGIAEFPQTMEQFWAAADQLKAAGITPTSQMTGGTNAWTSMLWYSHVVTSLGGPEVWERPLSDPLFTEAAEVLLRLYQDGNTTADAVGGDAGVSGGHYMAQDTAVFINGPWYIGRIRRDAPETHAATKLAYAPQVGDHHGFTLGFPLSNLAAANTDNPARRAAVVEFMQWLTAPANVQMITEQAGSMFALRYELGDDLDPLLQEFVRIVGNASFVGTPMFVHYPSEVILEIGQAIGAMVVGGASPADFVQMLIEAGE